MATEVISGRPRAESHTLRAEEERLRAHLEQQLRVRTRFAPLADVRALLVSPDRADRPKSLVVSSQASVAERIYLYVHVAAHIALGHNVPLVTIVEGAQGVHRFSVHHGPRDEELERAIWWGRPPKGADRRQHSSTVRTVAPPARRQRHADGASIAAARTASRVLRPAHRACPRSQPHGRVAASGALPHRGGLRRTPAF